MPSKNGAYYPALTGLRALAAFLVYAHHYCSHWYGCPSESAQMLYREAYTGVSLFFTLSGFLITRTYRETVASRKITYFGYWIRRFARVYPAYWAVLAFRYAVLAAPLSLAQVAANVTLTQGLFVDLKWTGVGQAWSLTIEESFYLLAPILYIAMGKKLTRTKALGVVLGTGLLLWGIGVAFWKSGVTPGFWSTEMDVELYNITGRFAEFGFGVLAAIWIAPPKKPTRKPPAIARWMPEFAFFTFVALLVADLRALELTKIHYNLTWGIYAQNGVFLLWISSLAAVAFFWSVVRGSRLANGIFGNPVSEYLGRISYAFFLLQDGKVFYWIEARAAEAVRALGGSWSPPTQFWTTALALGIVAAGIYHLIERPVHRLILKKAV